MPSSGFPKRPRIVAICARPMSLPRGAPSWRRGCLVANSEFEARLQTISSGLEARKLDALLVSFGPNLRYLSGFTGSNGNLLVLPGKAILFTDPRYTIQAKQEVRCQVRIAKGPLLIDVVGTIAKMGLKRIGY